MHTVFLAYFCTLKYLFRYRNKNRKNNRTAPLAMDHDYLTKKSKFIPKEQYDFLHSKKPIIAQESMTSKY